MPPFRSMLLAASALLASGEAQSQVIPIPTDVLADLDARVTVNTGQIAVLNGQVAANAADTIALSGRVDANVQALTTANANITAVRDQVTATATRVADVDARVTVNTGQIATLNGQVATNAADTAALSGRVDANTQALTTANANITAVRDQVTATTARVADIDTRLLAAADAAVTIEGRTTVLEGRVDTLAQGGVAVDARLAALGDRTTATETTVAGLIPQVTKTAQDVAAVTPQVAQNTQDIATLAPQVARNMRDIADVDARATTGLSAIGARVTLNDQRDDAQDTTLSDHDRRIRVAQSTADTGRAETATLRADVDAGRAGLVRQAGPSAPVTVAATSGGASVAFNGTAGDRRLTGVAAGIAANDAATVGQMNASAAETLTAANGYTDRSIASALTANDARFERLMAGNNRLLHADIDSSAAGSAALASLPQSIVPGSGMLGASIGGKGEQVAMALGLSKAFNAPHVPVLRAGAAIDTRTGDAVYNAAVGIHF